MAVNCLLREKTENGKKKVISKLVYFTKFKDLKGHYVIHDNNKYVHYKKKPKKPKKTKTKNKTKTILSKTTKKFRKF